MEEELSIIRSFFESWLMYMDGVEHKKIKAAVQEAIIATPSFLPPLAFYSEPIPGTYLITNETIDRFIQEAHSSLMGLNLFQWRELRSAMSPIMELLHTADYEHLIPRTASAIVTLLKWLPEQRFSAGSVVANMLTGGVPYATIAGVMVDSYEPVNCCVKTMVYEWAAALSKGTASAGSDLTGECLRHAPPFRFINRLLPDGDGIFSIDLAEVGKSARGNLAFGIGHHGCPGAGWAKNLLNSVSELLIGWEAMNPAVLCEGKLDRNGGLSTVQGLRATIVMQPSKPALTNAPPR